MFGCQRKPINHLRETNIKIIKLYSPKFITMKKKIWFIAMIGIAGLILTSCSKVRENAFVGKWEVLYKTIGYNNDETVLYDNWYILFFDNNTYVSGNDTEFDKEGTWFYNSSLSELTLGNKSFIVEKMGNKELALYTSEGAFSCYILKKIANF